MRTIVITPSQFGLTASEQQATWFALVARSADNWNRALRHCCSIRLQVAPLAGRWIVAEDGVNLLTLHLSQWCHNERCGKTSTFPLAALGMTTIFPADAVGAHVREADVEINGTRLNSENASPDWTTSVPGVAEVVSLETVLTHELGHVLGLGDACGDHYGHSGKIERGACTNEQR